ncbi:hypothetical protein AMJ85_09360 [candidate division BRC1 bacterium SM23_51]|nr:MAG: hypothetical protein AMJ85_09360 [candidate division BRC1 bacterium SM23_51]
MNRVKSGQCVSWRISTQLILTAAVLSLGLRAGAELVNTKLNGPLVTGGNVFSYRISDDSRWVVYAADQETDEARDIFSVPIDGGVPVRLNAALPAGVAVLQYGISPDSKRVVYAATQNSLTVTDMYSVPIQGPAAAATQINISVSSGFGVGMFQISPDNSRVCYVTALDLGAPLTLYSVPLNGPASASIPLTDLIEGSSISVQALIITPDSSRVVFRGYDWAQSASALFSVPIEGPASAAVRISEFLPPGAQLYQFEISPDGSRVVYLVEQITLNVRELFSAAVAGPPGDAVRLNTLLPINGTINHFEISPDSSAVVYSGRQSTANFIELYSVPPAGPAAAGVKLNKTLPAGGHVYDFAISPNSDVVAYRAEQDTDDVIEVYRVPLHGPASSGVKISDTIVAGGFVSRMDISPDGPRLVYVADMETAGDFDLYSVPLFGPATARVELSPTGGLLFNGDVLDFDISPDGSRVLYRGVVVFIFPTFEEKKSLYSVPVEGPGNASVLMNGLLAAEGDVSLTYGFTPDSHRAVYIADQDTNDVFELYVSYDRPTAAQTWNLYR